jgi:hypothetical protein
LYHFTIILPIHSSAPGNHHCTFYFSEFSFVKDPYEKLRHKLLKKQRAFIWAGRTRNLEDTNFQPTEIGSGVLKEFSQVLGESTDGRWTASLVRNLDW